MLKSIDTSTIHFIAIIFNLFLILVLFLNKSDKRHNLLFRELGAGYSFVTIGMIFLYFFIDSENVVTLLLVPLLSNIGFYFFFRSLYTFVNDREVYKEKRNAGITALLLSITYLLVFLKLLPMLILYVVTLIFSIVITGLIVHQVYIEYKKSVSNSAMFLLIINSLMILMLVLLLINSFLRAANIILIFDWLLQVWIYSSFMMYFFMYIVGLLWLTSDETISYYSKMALYNPVTGLPNLRYFKDMFLVEYANLYRRQSEFSIVVADVDHFASINQKEGYTAADYCLKEIAYQMRSKIRKGDLICHHNGDEFYFLFPYSKLEETISIIERIQQQVKHLDIKFEQKTLSITLSFGVLHTNRHDLVFEDLINFAQIEMMKAKTDGRDQYKIIEMYEDIKE